MHDLVVPVARDVAHVHERVAAAFQHGASFCFLLLERRVDDDVPRFEEVAHPHHLLHVLGAVAVAPLVVLEHDRLLRAGRQGHRVAGVGRAAEPIAEGVPVRLVRKRRADGVIGLVRRRVLGPALLRAARAHHANAMQHQRRRVVLDAVGLQVVGVRRLEDGLPPDGAVGPVDVLRGRGARKRRRHAQHNLLQHAEFLHSDNSWPHQRLSLERLTARVKTTESTAMPIQNTDR